MPLEQVWNPNNYNPARPARQVTVTASSGGKADGSLYAFTVVDGGFVFGGREGNGSFSNSMNHLGTWGDIGICPFATCNADGRVEVFLVGSQWNYWHMWETTANSGVWTGWNSLSDPSVSGGLLAVGQNQDGRLEVFGGGGQGIIHAWQDSSGQFGGWSGWAPLGSPADTGGGRSWEVAVGRNHDGRLEVFQIAENRDVWHNWQTSPNSGWHGWASLGAPPPSAGSAIAVGRWLDGRLEVFVSGGGVNWQIWHIWQTSPGGGWSGWTQLGTLPFVIFPDGHQSVAVGNDKNGNLVVYASNGDGQLYVTPSETTGWGTWGGVEYDATSLESDPFAQNCTLAVAHDPKIPGIGPAWAEPFFVTQNGSVYRWLNPQEP